MARYEYAFLCELVELWKSICGLSTADVKQKVVAFAHVHNASVRDVVSDLKEVAYWLKAGGTLEGALMLARMKEAQ